MREILFRGKSTDNGEWVYGVPIIAKDDIADKYITVMVDNPNEIVPMEGLSLFEQVDPETVGQYTGLTDKNGKKIFEGDIVRYNDTIHKVIFCTINGCAFFGITMPERGEIWNFDGITCANKMEVIGNIHGNPELLEGKS